MYWYETMRYELFLDSSGWLFAFAIVFALNGGFIFGSGTLNKEMSVFDTLFAKWNVSGTEGGGRERIRMILSGMADMPYENLTKILAGGERRTDEQLVRDYLRYGTGGTCFSLVSLFLTLAEKFGLDARPILADRSYGENTHCAVVVQTGEGRFLADPGFLIHRPVRLDGEQKVKLPHTTLRLDASGRVHTVYPDGHEKFRYQLHDEPVSFDELRDIWGASFDWEMMNQLVVNKVVGETHFYLRDTYLHENSKDAHRQRELEDRGVIRQVQRLGLDGAIAREAGASIGLFSRKPVLSNASST